MRNDTLYLTLIALLALIFFGCGDAKNPKEFNPASPNIVIIFTDDQGWNDLSCFGSPDIRTPHIDKLANEGARFTSFYVAQPVCSASRAALLTGCYPNRIGIHGALGPDSKTGIHDDEITIAEMLKNEGYSTAIYGKWHLGHGTQFNPLNHGFDEFFGIPYSNDMWPNHPWQGSVFDFPPLPLYDGFEIIDTLEDQSMLTTRITEKATRFIEKNYQNPFFLYVPHPQPHVPLYVSEERANQSKRGLYGDVIEEIDWSVGQIVKTLEEFDILDNTLVIFTSDNGPWLSYGGHSGSVGPLREGKGTNWEGGVRVPCVMRYPGMIVPGSEINVPVMTIDVMPTVAKLVGGSMPEHYIDGRDISGILSGESKESPHDAYAFYYYRNELQAIRSDQYKLILPHRYRTLGGRTGTNDGLPIDYEHVELENIELYDLSEDISESVDISAANPEIVERMLDLANTFRQDMGDRKINVEGTRNREPGRKSE